MDAPGDVAYEPLTPTSFLVRAALVHGERLAVVDGEVRLTYRELDDRCARLAGALAGMAGGAPVAVLAPNGHVALEAHYAVPWAGSPLVALNTRLTADELGWIVNHAEAGVLVYDEEWADTATAIAAAQDRPFALVRAGGSADEYEALVASGSPLRTAVADERSLLSVNYTSGTTGRPKGVMYHHRGAFLQSLAMAFHAGLQPGSAYLWTLPMFHCNGWCFTWAVTAAGATHVCQRKFDAEATWATFEAEHITHLCGAPTVLTSLAYAEAAAPRPESSRLRVCTGGSPPSPAILARMEELNVEVTHLYGLTETFGPSVICDWHPEWDERPADERARLAARQGVGNVISCPVVVVDEQGEPVPADGETLGEVTVRGNNVMLGYLRDPDATATAFRGGRFHTGDLAVAHPDGYIELKDRSKDVIISGGENISSIEVEQALAEHPAVLEVAVVAMPDDKWGEVPAAFVTPRPGATVTAEELIEFARGRLARFKAPKHVEFGELPKTSTGKIQKFALRDKAWQGRERRIN